MRNIVLLFALYLLAIVSFCADIKSCEEADARKDWNTALNVCRPLAEQNNPSAQAILGFMYAMGNGVSKDPREAFKWFRRSVRQGELSLPAFVALSRAYEEGTIVPTDLVEAYKWMYATTSFPRPLRDALDATVAPVLKRLSAKMSPQQVSEAEERFRDWDAGRACLISRR